MKWVEVVSIVAIAFALLAGGASMLVQIAHLHGAAIVALGAVGIFQTFAMVRRRRAAAAQLSYARDVAFLAATIAALAFVASPARWSLGAAVAAAEFGLLLELLARLVPERPVA